MSNKPILCLDFDGVLHSYKSGWIAADVIPDDPVEGAKEFLDEAVKHFKVCIHSSRSHQHGGIYAMQNWCIQHFGWTLVSQITFSEEKPPAFVTIDDRALTFDGTWPAIETLKAFQPWFKRKTAA